MKTLKSIKRKPRYPDKRFLFTIIQNFVLCELGEEGERNEQGGFGIITWVSGGRQGGEEISMIRFTSAVYFLLLDLTNGLSTTTSYIFSRSFRPHFKFY